MGWKLIRGRFITFEGGEGTGKSTQTQALKSYLESRGYEVIVVREPGGTAGGEEIRTLLQKQSLYNWLPKSELLLLYASRFDLVHKVILPALKRGAWVISDRFFDSTFVYQGYGQGVPLKDIGHLHTATLGDFAPDMTFFIDLPPILSIKRLEKRRFKDRFDSMNLCFHEKIYHGYKTYNSDHSRIVSIDGTQSKQRVFSAIKDHINDL